MRQFTPLLSILLLIGGAGPASAQGKEEPLVLKVKKSIDAGVRYLRNSQLPDGSWDVAIAGPEAQEGGTALAVLALLNSGVPVKDAMVDKGLRYLRSVREPKRTYTRALQTMAFAEANQKEDQERILNNVKWLIEAGAMDGGKFMGHSYTMVRGGQVTDNSNTQYAVLALWSAKQANIPIKREVWEGIREYYLRQQLANEGSFVYPLSNDRTNPRDATLTMTTAGLCGLLIAGMELNSGREKLLDDGTAKNCGDYEENKPAAKALSWVSNRFTIDMPERVFYNLYGLERAGRLSGLRFFGQFDWYREGSAYLVKIQRGDGHWEAKGTFDRYPVVSTSFALLFLSKGRTPILITKMVHGDWNPLRPGGARDDLDLDWNNDRNDLRHLVDFTSKNMFKVPLAWQTFDLMQAAIPRGNNENVTDKEVAEVTSEMLQSPIFYLTGHEAPRLRPLEKVLLKKYVENGGFILAEACCGRAEFDRGFKALAAELWPDNPLHYLDEKHMVWNSFYTVKPGGPSKLMGISMGCKVVLMYSPQDLSCRWESNNLENGAVREAFRLGANIIAYATGMEPPRPRLTQTQVAASKDPANPTQRGYFHVGQLKHGGNWQPAPLAMRNLMDHLNKLAGLDVVLKTQTLNLDTENLNDYKFIYMHGRDEFKMDPDRLADLRFNLKTGGLLFADACCGREQFDKSFRVFMEQLFPDRKLEEVPLDDILFSKELNGIALTGDSIKCRTTAGKEPTRMAPALEGIKINNRWVVLYSKYDIGCALERHQSSECLGYDTGSAFKLAGAAALYLLRP